MPTLERCIKPNAAHTELASIVTSTNVGRGGGHQPLQMSRACVQRIDQQCEVGGHIMHSAGEADAVSVAFAQRLLKDGKQAARSR